MSRGAAALGATWTAAHWPAVLAAAEHAHKAATSAEPEKFEFFTPAEAKEVQALASCIIPSDGTPGAREAGVVYFIDRALVTFSTDDQKTYREGLPGIQKRLKELFPGATVFSSATAEQQEGNRHRNIVPKKNQTGEHQGRNQQWGGTVPMALTGLIGMPAIEQHSGKTNESWNQ